MNRLIQWLVKFSVGAKIAAAVAWVHDKLDGKRSEIFAGLALLVHFLGKAGIIPADTVKVIEPSLIALLPVLVADRVSKVTKTVDGLVPDAKAN